MANSLTASPPMIDMLTGQPTWGTRMALALHESANPYIAARTKAAGMLGVPGTGGVGGVTQAPVGYLTAIPGQTASVFAAQPFHASGMSGGDSQGGGGGGGVDWTGDPIKNPDYRGGSRKIMAHPTPGGDPTARGETAEDFFKKRNPDAITGIGDLKIHHLATGGRPLPGINIVGENGAELFIKTPDGHVMVIPANEAKDFLAESRQYLDAEKNNIDKGRYFRGRFKGYSPDEVVQLLSQRYLRRAQEWQPPDETGPPVNVAAAPLGGGLALLPPGLGASPAAETVPQPVPRGTLNPRFLDLGEQLASLRREAVTEGRAAAQRVLAEEEPPPRPPSQSTTVTGPNGTVQVVGKYGTGTFVDTAKGGTPMAKDFPLVLADGTVKHFSNLQDFEKENAADQAQRRIHGIPQDRGGVAISQPQILPLVSPSEAAQPTITAVPGSGVAVPTGPTTKPEGKVITDEKGNPVGFEPKTVTAKPPEEPDTMASLEDYKKFGKKVFKKIQPFLPPLGP